MSKQRTDSLLADQTPEGQIDELEIPYHANRTETDPMLSILIEKEKRRHNKKGKNLLLGCKVMVALTLLTIIILAIVFASEIDEGLNDFFTWMGDNAFAGSVILIAIFVLVSVLLIPAVPVILQVGAGYAYLQVYKETAWALFVGSTVMFVAMLLGSMCAFLMGRYVFRSSVERLSRKYRVFKAIDIAIEREGLKVCALLRMTPLFPYAILNYLMGGTKISFKHYMIAGLGMFPRCVVYVYIGTTISNLQDITTGNYSGGTVTLVFLIIGTLLACIGIAYITVIVKRYMKREMSLDIDDESDTTSTYGGNEALNSLQHVQLEPLEEDANLQSAQY